jgi:hypothetical protein
MPFPWHFCPIKLGASGLRLPLSQATINPKTETCEDLQSRRMRLHVGMCKMARVDLERQLIQNEYDLKVV